MYIFLKRLFNVFVFGNFFIGICSVSMGWATLILNGLPVRITPFTVFLFTSTYLLYNFHRVTYQINFTGYKAMTASLVNMRFSRMEKFFYLVFVLATFACVFSFSMKILLLLLPLAMLGISYTIPLIKYQGRYARLPELPLIKTPVLAIVWGLSTTILPLAEQNIPIATTFCLLQVVSRSLFIYALCIPFEMRDAETDRFRNIRTFPVVHGLMSTRIVGSLVIILEIISHHLMPVSTETMIMLDLSSIVAWMWILLQDSGRKPYYYKFLIDGTMLLRFLLLLIVIGL